jgi:imidazolonepropionase-like amidohydrolase
VLPRATVVLRDGIIAAVGANVAAPPDARLWELDGKTVYPGLIDAWVPRPWPLEGEGEAPQGTHPNAAVRADRDVVERLRNDEAWPELRAAGFTTALVVPGDGIFRGQGALANLGDDPRRALLRPRAFQIVALSSPKGLDGYPSSTMGAVALFRQTILDARWHRLAQAAYRANPAQERPPYDAALAALESAAHGEAPVAFETDSLLGTLRALRLAEELDLRGLVVGSGAEYQRLDEIRARPLPLVLPVAFPAPPDVGEEDDHAVGLDELRHWDQAPANPARLADARLPFAITAFRQKSPKDLWKQVAEAIERGLDPDRALAALTQVPAELLGISGRAGTIEAGKMANLVVVEGDLLVEEPKVEAVWIDGEHYPIEAGKKGGKKNGDKEKKPEVSR